tara:strand:- start:17811 stop:18839 length:1029 start_codon:yes stop_codon:yes gene_type:complete
MRITHLLSVALLATTSIVWAGPEKDLSGNAIFDQPNKQIDFGKLKYFKKSDTILVPFVEVKLQNWGTQGVVAETGGFGSKTQTAQARSTLASSVDPKIAQDLATKIHKDLIESMRAEGWNVITFDDVKDTKAYQKLKWEKDEELGQGIKVEKKDGKFMGVGMADSSGNGFIIAVPEGQQFLKYGITGPAWAMRKVVKAEKVNLFIPTYTINTMYFAAEGKKSLFGDRASAEVSSGPLVSLGNVTAYYLNPKLAGSGMAFKEKAYGKNTGVAGGKLVSAKDTSPKAANALGAVFRAVGGAGIQKNSSERVIESNDAEVEAEALKLAGAYNDVIARASALYKGK